jgi:hypothetical protein
MARLGALTAALFTLCIARALDAQQKERQIEVRIDGITVAYDKQVTVVDFRFPGAAAVGLYLNDIVSIELRTLGLSRTQIDASNDRRAIGVTGIGVEAFVPIHFNRTARGRRGFFIAPGFGITRTSVSGGGDNLFDTPNRTAASVALDIGFKHTLKGRVSFRHAITLREGDDVVSQYGASSGISIFFR